MLEPRPVGDIVGDFWVPSYQRGYRWGPDEVRLLLDDVWESKGEPYYLQPIVVKPADGKWELIDGQQRLTTLFLILQFMWREGLQSAGPLYSLSYETRGDSQSYLEAPDEARHQDNIDFFHIYSAYECIRGWFDAHGHRRQFVANEFYGFLFKSVQVIWYEAAHDLDSRTLFTRLNVGRIPLTNAELVKALLLSRSGSRREEIAAQWDVIERELQQPDLWAFAAGKTDVGPTRISLLLDSLAGGPTGRERPLFHTLEALRERLEASPLDLWNAVVDLHALLLGWYEDRDVYHKVGYLVATGTNITELADLARTVTKSSFSIELDRRIRQSLSMTAADLADLSYGNASKCEQVLLLMNVATVSNRKHSLERFAFREHVDGAWSLEHIHAQNAEALNRADQWREWLRLHRRAVNELVELQSDARADLLARIDAALADVTEHKFRKLETEVAHVFTHSAASEADVHAISNLALLARTDNSALSNSVFEVKRRQILERDKDGAYIPPATRNVFLKYYTDADAHQIHFWGSQDRKAYLDAMRVLLRPYLTGEENA